MTFRTWSCHFTLLSICVCLSSIHSLSSWEAWFRCQDFHSPSLETQTLSPSSPESTHKTREGTEGRTDSIKTEWLRKRADLERKAQTQILYVHKYYVLDSNPPSKSLESSSPFLFLFLPCFITEKVMQSRVQERTSCRELFRERSSLLIHFISRRTRRGKKDDVMESHTQGM